MCFSSVSDRILRETYVSNLDPFRRRNLLSPSSRSQQQEGCPGLSQFIKRKRGITMKTYDEDMPERNADRMAEERSQMLDQHELDTVSGGGQTLGTFRAPHLWDLSPRRAPSPAPSSPVSSVSSVSSRISELSTISATRSDFAHVGDAAIHDFVQRNDAIDALKATLRRTKSNPF